jgi:hypothetical protein
MEEYTDPENIDEILNEITQSRTLGEIKNITDRYLDGWIICMIDEYSSDYQHLTNNWNNICRQLGIEKKCIIIVKLVSGDDNHRLIRTVSEILTKLGFVVRDIYAVDMCVVCRKCIPSKKAYDMMKNMNIKIPDEWSNKCENC